MTIPYYLTATSWIWNTAPILIFPGIVLFTASLCSKIFLKKWINLETFISSFCISTLGLTIGFLSGFNERSAIESVLPAFLALVGILLPYLAIKEPKKVRGISITILILSTTTLIGAQWGYNQAYASKVATRSKNYLIRQSELEAAVILERKKLKLNENLEVKPLPDDIIKK